MDRRGTDVRRRILLVLPAVVITLLIVAFAIFQIADRSNDRPAFETQTVASIPGFEEPSPNRPRTTVSEFFPEDSNLSDCLGLVEKPGCGSESRGGWRQTAVFVAIAVGLGLVIWRIAAGVRSNRPPLS